MKLLQLVKPYNECIKTSIYYNGDDGCIHTKSITSYFSPITNLIKGITHQSLILSSYSDDEVVAGSICGVNEQEGLYTYTFKVMNNRVCDLKKF